MARTTSARSSVTRDQPSSPPNAINHRQSQSPRRATRSMRSQSRELGKDYEDENTRRAGKRSSRQASVESVESNISAASSKASSRGGRTRNAVSKAIAARGRSFLSGHLCIPLIIPYRSFNRRGGPRTYGRGGRGGKNPAR
jgi:hypothetical protein